MHAEISQHQAARLPFRSRYPTAKLVAWVLKHARMLRPFEPARIIDTTFGQGVFWHALRSKVLAAAVDIHRLDWVVEPRCFIQRPAQKWQEWLEEALQCLNGKPDLVAVDPPWQVCIRGNGCHAKRIHYRASHAWGRPEEILGADIALAHYLNVPLLYHWREPLEYEHLVGPIAFKPFYHVINPRASQYRSYFGIVRG